MGNGGKKLKTLPTNKFTNKDNGKAELELIRVFKDKK